MVVTYGNRITAIHRCVHEKLTDVWQHVFRLRKVDELPLTGALPVVQGTQDRKCRTSAARCIHVVDRRAGTQVEIGIAAYSCQATEGFHIAAKALKGAIGTSTAKARHGHVDDVGFPL